MKSSSPVAVFTPQPASPSKAKTTSFSPDASASASSTCRVAPAPRTSTPSATVFPFTTTFECGRCGKLSAAKAGRSAKVSVRR